MVLVKEIKQGFSCLLQSNLRGGEMFEIEKQRRFQRFCISSTSFPFYYGNTIKLIFFLYRRTKFVDL